VDRVFVGVHSLVGDEEADFAGDSEAVRERRLTVALRRVTVGLNDAVFTTVIDCVAVRCTVDERDRVGHVRERDGVMVADRRPVPDFVSEP